MWFRVLLTCLFSVAAVTTLSGADRPREPIPLGAAVVLFAVDGLLIWGVWAALP